MSCFDNDVILTDYLLDFMTFYWHENAIDFDYETNPLTLMITTLT